MLECLLGFPSGLEFPIWHGLLDAYWGLLPPPVVWGFPLRRAIQPFLLGSRSMARPRSPLPLWWWFPHHNPIPSGIPDGLLAPSLADHVFVS